MKLKGWWNTMKKFLITLLAMVLAVSMIGCGGSSSDKNNTKSSFALNETATLKNLKVTATAISESAGESFFTPDSGNIFVGIQFTIENISKEDQVVSSMLQFEVYADDVKCNYSISALAAFSDGPVDGTIAPGKKLMGWYAVEVPETWQRIEVDFLPDLLSSSKTKFVFLEKDATDYTPGTNNGGGTNDTTNPPAGTTAGLNESVTLKTLKLTATEWKESMGETYFTPENGKVFVGVKFTIENTSNADVTVSSLMQFTAYVDDVLCNYSISAAMAFPDGTLDGTLAAGKKLVGWYAVEVPENWQNLEIVFQEDLFSSSSVSFHVSR